MNSLPRPGKAWATARTDSLRRTVSGSQLNTRSNPSQTVTPKSATKTAGDSAISLCRSAQPSKAGNASRTIQNTSSRPPTMTAMKAAFPTSPGSGPSGSHAPARIESTTRTATRFADHCSARATDLGSTRRTRWNAPNAAISVPASGLNQIAVTTPARHTSAERPAHRLACGRGSPPGPAPPRGEWSVR